LYVVRTAQRNLLRDALQTQGVATVIHYPVAPHLQPCYPTFADAHLPLAQVLADEVLSLPMSPAMTDAQVAQVVHAVNGWAG
jgi:dTDP-4-amino-4,6-dideoxygalactose transaminase